MILILLALVFSTSAEYFRRPEIINKNYNSTTFDLKGVQLGCKELRSKKYISDGYCTSAKPITEVVCAGVCLPVADLFRYTEIMQIRPRTSFEWRCINDVTKRERIHLVCRNGNRRSYKIRLVKSCKCKKFAKVVKHFS
ncbi:sclerostin domain-containing protein 1-like [Centruroides sculpturatus]|uniref:sclerostin domain-containing protein 1-like n=1 Tax=Centruroides sculpturatus TaxID=218467 RepID=UPI000C6DF8C4|nr:sclerostin domain-containing protein 1-like [Centruroides sculpturatus]